MKQSKYNEDVDFHIKKTECEKTNKENQKKMYSLHYNQLLGNKL